MRAPAWLGSLGPKRWIALGVGVALLVAAVVVVGGRGDDDETVATESADTTSTSTPRRITTTSVATTSTTAAVTTTSTATAEPPVDTATTAAPAPVEQPPPTEPAPPPTTEPAPLGGLDIAAVVAFAQQHRDESVVPPTTTTGGSTCPQVFSRTSDAGDDGARDIGADWYLARYCDGTYRVALPTTDEAPLQAFWMEADTQAGGCAGADRVVVGWQRPSGQSIEFVGDVIATPTCDPSSWQWLDAAGAPLFNYFWLQLDIRGSALGAGASFQWRGFVRAAGDDATDAVPNAGPEHFVVS